MQMYFFLSGDHVAHLENVSEEEMNRLLGIVLDVEYLYTCVHKEEDADTKQVYFSLFKVSFCYCCFFVLVCLFVFFVMYRQHFQSSVAFNYTD